MRAFNVPHLQKQVSRLICYVNLNSKDLSIPRSEASFASADSILSILSGKNVPVDTHFTSKSLIIATL
jgi:hypothetical protein